MPGGDLEILVLSLCLSMSRNVHLSEYEQERGRRTLMNLTNFFPVS